MARDLSIKWEAGQGFHVPGLRTVNCNTVQEMLKVCVCVCMCVCVHVCMCVCECVCTCV
jgi:hypothetical protein